MSDPATERPGTGMPPAAAGRTVISDSAVAKVAGIAARGVPGVYALGSGSTRAIGAIREVVGAADLSQGIRVEVGETQVAVDVDLVAEYGSPLQDVANRVRAEVYRSIQELVGLHVIEVNVEVNDVHIGWAEAAKAPAKAKTPELANRGSKASSPEQHQSSGESP